jgi:hypothetical protein
VVDIYLNNIHLTALHKNQTHSFETYAGLNTIKIKVSGTDYKPFVKQIDLQKNECFVINGYFSRARLISTLISWIAFDVFLFILFFSYSLLTNLFGLFILFLSLPFILQIGHALYYFVFKKRNYVFLISE